MDPTASIDELAARAKAGDRDSFDELAARMRDPLRAFVAKRMSSSDEADDVVQETLLRAYQNIDRYDPSYRFSTWVHTIAKRLAANHEDRLRRGQRRSRELASVTEERDGARSATDAREAQDLWRRARELLSDAQYAAIRLRYVDDLPVSEIARTLGRTQTSTKVLLYRARRKLLSEGI